MRGPPSTAAPGNSSVLSTTLPFNSAPCDPYTKKHQAKVARRYKTTPAMTMPSTDTHWSAHQKLPQDTIRYLVIFDGNILPNSTMRSSATHPSRKVAQARRKAEKTAASTASQVSANSQASGGAQPPAESLPSSVVSSRCSTTTPARSSVSGGETQECGCGGTRKRTGGMWRCNECDGPSSDAGDWQTPSST